MDASKRARALALIQATLDPARESGDGLLAVQRKFGLSTVDGAALLWAAFSASGKRAAAGSIAERLLRSDSAGSFPYAQRQRYVPDDTAPVVSAGTLVIGETRVSRLGLGCMRIVSQSAKIRGVEQNALGVPRSPEASRHALLTAIDVCGVRYFDVARGYGPWPGFGERLLHEWLSARAPDVMVASKVGYRRARDGSWAVDLDPAFIEDEVRASHELLVTHAPFELYFDYRAAATWDVGTGAFSFAPTSINALPIDVDGDAGTFEIDAGGRLILRDLWLGTFDENVPGCGHVLVR